MALPENSEACSASRLRHGRIHSTESPAREQSLSTLSQQAALIREKKTAEEIRKFSREAGEATPEGAQKLEALRQQQAEQEQREKLRQEEAVREKLRLEDARQRLAEKREKQEEELKQEEAEMERDAEQARQRLAEKRERQQEELRRQEEERLAQLDDD
ncbi:MAG: hypothetical protein IIA14_07810, partial [SAR324 cluster bacterium]|nr:hypothetical protein [SAR324 cluster bacterium]